METVSIEIHDKTYKRIIKRLRPFIFTAISMLVFALIPSIVLRYYTQNGYSFKENVGLVRTTTYDSIVTSLINETSFEYELAMKTGFINLGVQTYRTIIASKDIFEVGVLSDFFSNKPISFYDITFLHGQPFSDDEEIVISKSISQYLFNTINSINETVVIDNKTFTVSGVVDEPVSSMQYIFFSESAFPLNIDAFTPFIDYIVFQDENLIMKLYDRGQSALVFSTMTLNNQQPMNSTKRIISNLMVIILSFISLALGANRKTSEKNKEQGSKQTSVLKSLSKTYIIMTFFVIYMIILYAMFIAMSTSLVFGFRYLLDMNVVYFIIVFIYLIPIAIQGIKWLKKL